MLLFDDIATEYRDFAAYAEGDSPSFAEWSTQVADDAEVIAWLATLPPIKHQPNLVFAAARFHGVPAPGPYAGFRAALLGDDGPIRDTILSHATQTNEVGRLATLLPAFGQVSGPLALLEVGTSAGLCLYPDRWAYRWRTDAGDVVLGESADPAGELDCRVKGAGALPTSLPEVAWRGGIDLNPLDVTDASPGGDMAWLRTLIWPEHEDRRVRLDRAISVAQADPPHVLRGDLLEELPALVDQASAYGTVVVFHSAVIAYLEPGDRERFDRLIRGLVAEGRCHWVSNEGKNVLPSVTATGPVIDPAKQTFVLGLDGHAIAHTHGHGRTLRWL